MPRQKKEKPECSQETKVALREKVMNEVFTPEERKILSTGTSNKGCHYLGSSKIMAQIGKAFADATAEMNVEGDSQNQ